MLHRNPWLDLTLDTISLGMEANAVIGLRLMKAFVGGPAADKEASRMVAEKLEALVDLQTSLMATTLTSPPHLAPARAVAMYRKKVQANQARLLGGG